jgi:hypothetical protein
MKLLLDGEEKGQKMKHSKVENDEKRFCEVFSIKKDKFLREKDKEAEGLRRDE